ncbi:hypothetical protein [Meiothermus hypogaeus]|uniref:Uncharacterized protein n=2 Tax=Meiothermus hypogaeus TaxID=884155 RepID=A0A511R490_9DEIN|nr:hypothetical protein [Meiothermus hypogaeus]RIH74370.1 hypothetical protein Mhypo_03378 [Meiothermus hypogaeus]GEM84375.1 hypothetical protein MHY01S_25410 [Meiothermus hypogaeus NBRC 106114]
MKGRNIFYFSLGAVLVAAGLYGLSVGNLTNFTAGTPIRASEVNTNFSVLRSAIEALEAPVDTARLADRAVSAAKMADQGCPAGQALGGYSNGNPTCVAVQGGAGLTEVARDGTLTGNGTAANPLSLANNAVATAKLVNGAVTTGKLAEEAITSGKIAKLPLTLESTGAPQLEVRETSPGQFSQLRLSVQGSPNFWEIAAREVLHIYRQGSGNLVTIQTNGDMNLTGDISQPRTADGTVKASALIHCGASPSVARSFNQVTGTITVEGGGTAGRCILDLGFDISDRFWQVSSYKVSGTTGLDPQIVNCEFSAGAGNNKLTCNVRSITTGNLQSGSFMITVF